ncbi:MAG TPA: hypothetical protein VNW99_10760 [Cytophagaceae bacterium]|nr:hypothetical protein [Cytophagaceae bacterium]
MITDLNQSICRKLIAFASIIFVLALFSNVHSQPKDTANTDFLKERAKLIQENAARYKVSATEIQTEYAGYKAQAQKCKGAMDEANDGLKMANEAVQDCETADKLAQKIIAAKKNTDMLKMLKEAQKKMDNCQYLIQQANDRRKEVLFELKGCK